MLNCFFFAIIHSKDDFLEHNMFSFQEIKNPNNLTININARIQRLSIWGSAIRKLDKQLFERLKYIWPWDILFLYCGFVSIEADFFKNFKPLHGIL